VGIRKRALRAALPLAAATLLAGCAKPPVRVERVDPEQVHRELTASVLSSGRPSARSVQLLERFGLRRRYRDDPEGVLALLHQGLAPQGDHRRLSALGELSFHHALRTGDRRYYMMAAVYSYALLFPGTGEETLDESDPRLRLAYDLYNRGLTEALAFDRGGVIHPHAARYELPIGTLEVAFSEQELYWAGHRLDELVSAADYDVKGLRNRYRRPGIGAPLSAKLGEEALDGAVPSERFLPGMRVPITLLSRIEEPRRALHDGRLRARVELYTPDEALVVAIDGREVPVEFEASSSLASSLADSPLWDFELRGFFSGSFRPLAKAVEVVGSAVVGQQPVEKQEDDEGLLFLYPYRPGRIPVVLVHGTASSPGRWADLVNELQNDRLMWDRYQIWLFLYNTGNPIGYSGALLRRSLENAVADLDPEGSDPALREMVVIGHSQGGLLSKLTSVESGERFWNLVSSAPLDELELDEKVRETLRASTYFSPEPFVKRLVFVCTPHGGSYLAAFSLASTLSDLVALPSNLTQVMTELVTQNQDKLLLRSMSRLPTSIDNMTPGNPFLKVLGGLPVAPGVKAHSIIAVDGDGPLEGASDGVVRYESAHVPGVESELVVRSSHSAQGHPETIEEIRRILLEHAGIR
jgi:pimeloyl-ACP methyl ester carboxylesterase